MQHMPLRAQQRPALVLRPVAGAGELRGAGGCPDCESQEMSSEKAQVVNRW